MIDNFEIREQGFSDDGEDIMVREYTTKLIDLVEEGIIDSQTVLTNLVNWLSESDIQDFFKDEYKEFDEDNEDEYDL